MPRDSEENVNRDTALLLPSASKQKGGQGSKDVTTFCTLNVSVVVSGFVCWLVCLVWVFLGFFPLELQDEI